MATHDEFRTFFRGLPPLGYWLDCLRRLYEAPAETIRSYMREDGIAGHNGQCGICYDNRETFRFKVPS
jgi:hypothetical protein